MVDSNRRTLAGREVSVKPGLLKWLVAAATLVFLGSEAAAQNGPVPIIHHPTDCNGQPSFFPLVQASIANVRLSPLAQEPVSYLAVPGTFRLRTVSVGGRRVLDVAAYATCPKGQSNPFVQSFRLIKEIPGSQSCPERYPPQRFFQFGSGIRTFWALAYTQPGTTFALELTVVCRTSTGGTAKHIDRWVWKVVASPCTLSALIDVLHDHPIGTSEVSCIQSEALYVALKENAKRIGARLARCDRQGACDEIFTMEGLILSQCLFTDCFGPPPEDFSATEVSPLLVEGGILDTPENPCCCVLLVTLEYVAQRVCAD